MLNPLDLEVKYLKGVGERRASLLKKELGIERVRDLLFYLPYKHVDRTRIYKVAELHEEMPYVQLQGVIEGFWFEGEKYRKRLKARFYDETGEMELVWFNQVNYFSTAYKPGVRYTIFGKPSRYGFTYSIAHPEVEEADKVGSSVGVLYPIYSVTDRLRKARLTSKEISELVKQVLMQYGRMIAEVLPEYIVKHYGMLSRGEAIQNTHFPRNSDYLRRAMLRLKMEELFYLRLKMQIQLSRRKQESVSFRFTEWGRGYEELYNRYLGFHLTGAQERVMGEINIDLESGKQMNRLLQGDVGSGKTIIALLAMLRAVGNGFQACMMAPTEILASQHYATLKELLKHQPYIRVALLTGSMRAKQKREVVEALQMGEIDILVGTHILIEDYVSFAQLGLVVIDEQHRFGVSQRAQLWDKSSSRVPHILIMSATPIPRTLAMTIYGDLDVSVIDELPPGRSPIKTWHAFDYQRGEVYGFILDQVNAGRQVYAVYPLIEESEKIDLESLEEGFEDMKSAFPALKVGMVHGRMKADEKEATMAAFVSGETNILVATTVIEVGVNVPNATVMLINHAERFGLSQLHQLRGRVGRSSYQSFCILMTSDSIGENSQKRVEIMCRSTDGFYIAEQDMLLRGHGDMEGTMQSGEGGGLKIADLSRDGRVIQFVANLVAHILGEDPHLELQKNAILRYYVDKLISEEKDWGMIS